MMKSYKYVLLNPHHPGDAHSQSLLNQVYEAWKKTFHKVVTDMGGELNHDDFFRYDHIGAIFDDDKLVASHCYSFFNLNLECCRDHHFIKNIADSAIEKLISQGQTHIFSLEYSQVLPDYRKSKSNIHWLDVLTGCGLFYLDESPAHGIIGTPRVDLKVDQATYRLGAIELHPPIKKMNYECAVIYFPKMKNRCLPEKNVQEVTHLLWNQREYAPSPAINSQPLKIA